MVKKPYQTHRMTPASAYWHYLKSFCAFGIPDIEPLYMKKDAVEALPGIYKAFRELYAANSLVNIQYNWYTEKDFVKTISSGNYSYSRFLKILLGSHFNLSILPYTPELLKAIEQTHEIMAPVREEMNRMGLSRYYTTVDKPWYSVRIRSYGVDGNKHIPIDLHPQTSKDHIGRCKETPLLPKEVIEYAVTKERDRYLTYSNIFDINTQAANGWNMPLSSFDNGTPFPSSIPLHIAMPYFSRTLRFVCERTFGYNKHIRMYPIRQDNHGTVYVIHIPTSRLERYMHAECAATPGKNPHKDHFLAVYREILAERRNIESASRMIFVARVVNGTASPDGYHTAHWIRTPPQHGGGVRNVMAHVYGIEEHQYVLGQGRT